jgi:hypothetical protein
MIRRRLHRRSIDVAVVLTAVVLCTWPLLGVGSAAVATQQLHVDQKVRQAVSITKPLDGAFVASKTGRANGSVSWEASTTNETGYKLVVSSDGTPALRDAAGNADVADMSWTPGAWSVGSSDRRFGFSATGDDADNEYGGNGDRWRGFRGRKTTEVARNRSGARPMTRTRVKLASEMGLDLPSSSNPEATVVATAMVNL